ncbi:MAG: GNAT family N-acetyltransferase [Ferruginibacter sp.]
MNNITVRPIQEDDNMAMAKIIRNALEEFNANKPGTVYFDETTDHLYELFKTGKGNYHVVVMNDEIAGGAGIYPTAGLEADTVELVKLYLAPTVRGKGLGKLLMEKCLETAKEAGYKKVYIETMPELIVAIPIYEKFGFAYLNGPLGNSGHNGCDIWMIKML